MNEIEKIFSNSLEKYLRNEILVINNTKYEVKKESDNTFHFKNNKTKFDFFIEFCEQPKDDCFSGYRPDLAIFINGGFYGFVIEIDGYQWHEKSKEQARIDKEKDRTYLKKCFIPVRFTGYEVYHHSNNCVYDLFEIVEANIHFFNSINLSEVTK